MKLTVPEIDKYAEDSRGEIQRLTLAHVAREIEDYLDGICRDHPQVHSSPILRQFCHRCMLELFAALKAAQEIA